MLIRSLTGATIPLVAQGASAAFLPLFRLLISPFENFPFPGAWAEARGYSWFSKRKSAFQRTHGETGWPRVKIRRYRTAHGSKQSSFAADEARDANRALFRQKRPSC